MGSPILFRLTLNNGTSVNTVLLDVKRRAGCAPAGRRSTRSDFRRERLAIRVAKEIAGELGERALIHVALEIDHRLERHPVVVPPPGVEFGPLGRAQLHVALATDQAQQKPDLFLPPVVAAPIPLEPPRRNFVAQPVSGP